MSGQGSSSALLGMICRVLAAESDPLLETLTADDWQEMGRLADANGLAPLLYREMDRRGWPAQAGAARQSLAAGYYKTAAHNTLLFSEMKRLASAFTGEGIEVVWMKGATLATWLYPDPALRPMNDLDLLVRRGQLEQSAQLLFKLGYTEEQPAHLGMAGWVNQAANHHIHFRGGPQNRAAVELHWNLIAGDADWRTPPLDWFWEGKIPHPSQPGGASLSPEASLLYMAAHIYLQHIGSAQPLIWYYDIHLLVQRCASTLDWQVVRHKARDYRWSDALQRALEQCHTYFGTPVPQEILEGIRLDADPQAARLVEHKTRPTGLRTLDTLRSLDSLQPRTRLRLLLALAFPAPSNIRYRYAPRPSWLWPVYYPYRWLDILQDGLATLIRSLRKTPR